MSQNTLIEKIKQDATDKVAEIKAAGLAEVENIQSETEAAVSKMTKEYEVALQKTKDRIELVAVSKAKQAGNIAVQSEKRNQINNLFSAVTKELAEQSADDYVKFFTNFAKSVVPAKLEVTSVVSPVKREEETKDIIKALHLQGDVVTDASLSAGLTVNATDGSYDVSLDRLVNDKRAELEMLVVNKVLG